MFNTIKFINNSVSRVFNVDTLPQESLPNRAKGVLMLNTSQERFEGETPIESKIDSDSAFIKWNAGSLSVSSSWNRCDKTGIWSRKDIVENNSEQEIEIYGSVYRFAFASSEYEIYCQNSSWCSENQGEWQPLAFGTTEVSCFGGRTCMGAAPYMCLRDKETKKGVIFNIIPQGNWVIRVSKVLHNEEFLCVVELGLSDKNLKLKIRSGGKLELPEILICPLVDGEPHLSAHLAHKYLLNHQLKNHRNYAPVVYNSWFNDFDCIDVNDLEVQVKAAKEIGCEVFVVDAGWYGTGTDWFNYAGCWEESETSAFYGKMKEFADYVCSEGLGFGLWMEPERVCEKTPVYNKHSDWFKSAGNGFYYYDLENAEAFGFLYNEICRLIERYNLAWMKMDWNFDFGLDESGCEFNRYYSMWYKMLDNIKNKHPQVFLESCSSGGMRHDIGILSHSDSHFLTDTVNPVDVIRIYEGALLRHAPGYIGKWAVLRNVGSVARKYDTPYGDKTERIVTPCDAVWGDMRSYSADFVMKTAMTGMPGVSSDIHGLPEYAKQEMKKWIEYYKTKRGFITRSVAHLLTKPKLKNNKNGWSAVQLQNPDYTTSMLFVYRLEDSRKSKRFFPKGLNSAKTYRITSPDMPDFCDSISGEDIMKNGILINIDKNYESKIFEISEHHSERTMTIG